MNLSDLIEIKVDKKCIAGPGLITFPDSVIAGKSSQPLKVTIKNISKFELIDLEFYADDQEVLIEPKFVEKLSPNDEIEITLKWIPSKTRQTPLLTSVSVKGKVVRRVGE